MQIKVNGLAMEVGNAEVLTSLRVIISNEEHFYRGEGVAVVLLDYLHLT